jgi:hypothetical protein
MVTGRSVTTRSMKTVGGLLLGPVGLAAARSRLGPGVAGPEVIVTPAIFLMGTALMG